MLNVGRESTLFTHAKKSPATVLTQWHRHHPRSHHQRGLSQLQQLAIWQTLLHLCVGPPELGSGPFLLNTCVVRQSTLCYGGQRGVAVLLSLRKLEAPLSISDLSSSRQRSIPYRKSRSVHEYLCGIVAVFSLVFLQICDIFSLSQFQYNFSHNPQALGRWFVGKPLPQHGSNTFRTVTPFGC